MLRISFLFFFFCIGNTLAAQPDQQLQQARQLSNSGYHSAANELLTTFIAQYTERLYDLGDAYALRSQNALAMGQLGRAAADNAKSEALRQELIPEEVGKNRVQAGAIALAQGLPRQALEALRQATAYPYFDDLGLAVRVDELRGRAYAVMGEYDKAQSAYEDALGTLLVLTPEAYRQRVQLHHLMGELSYMVKDYKTAARHLADAIELGGKEEKAPELAAAYITAGDVAFKRRRMNKALTCYDAAISLYGQLYGSRHPEIVHCWIRKAEVRIKQDSLMSALTATQNAERLLCPDSPDGYTGPKTFCTDLFLLSEVLYQRSLFLRLLGSHATPLATQNSIAALEQYALLYPVLRPRLQLLQQAQKLYGQGIGTALIVKQDDQAFELAQRWLRFRSRHNDKWREKLTPETGGEVMGLYNDVLARRSDYLLHPDSTYLLSAYEAQQSVYYGKLQALRSTAPDLHQEYVEQEAPDIQAQLSKEEGYVQYFMAGEQLYAFAADRDQLRAVALDPPPVGWAVATGQYKKLLEQGEATGIAKAGWTLYSQLLDSVMPILDKKKVLIIVPDGPLEQLPFGSLVTRPVRGRKAKLKRLAYLGDEYEVKVAK